MNKIDYSKVERQVYARALREQQMKYKFDYRKMFSIAFRFTYITGMIMVFGLLVHLNLTLSEDSCILSLMEPNTIELLDQVETFKQVNEYVLLRSAIEYKESRGNPSAVGDNGKAIGILQIWPITVRDANRILDYDKFTLQDRWNIEKSREIYDIIVNHYTPNFNAEKIARRWNGGPDGDTEPETLEYWYDVKERMRRGIL